MKTLKLIALFAFLFTGSFSAHSQAKTGKVYLIRSTGYAGLAVNYHFFVDGKLVCKQKNKSYSIQDLSVGDHMVNVTTGGLKTAKKNTCTEDYGSGRENKLCECSKHGGRVCEQNRLSGNH